MKGPLFAACLTVGLTSPGGNAAAGEVYQCEIAGVKTFVDSIRRCPAGTAQQVGGAGQRNNPAASGPESHGPTRPNGARHASLVVSACGRPSPADPTAFRACVREQRRLEVRAIAMTRLAGLARSVSEFIDQPSRMAGLIAVDRANARPAAWCEGFLRDVVSGRNLDVVDDESPAGPRWVTTGVGNERKAAPLLDENFRDVQTVDGGRVASGYVTVRWRTGDPLVLRVDSSCFDYPGGVVRCNPTRIRSVLVYDDATPVACYTGFIGRPYWPNWSGSMTQIFAGETEGTDLARQGVPPRKERKAPRTALER